MSNKYLIAALPLAAAYAILVSPPAAAQQGMVVVRDEHTGQLRAPTPAEAQAMALQRPAAAKALPEASMVTNPDGSRQVHLGERGMVYSVVTRGADGKLHGQCVHGESAAVKAAAASVPAAKHNEEHRHESR